MGESDVSPCRQTYAEPYNEEALKQYHQIDQLVDDMRLAEAYYRGGDHRACAELVTRLLETSPWSAHLRQLRAQAYTALVSGLAGGCARPSATRSRGPLSRTTSSRRCPTCARSIGCSRTPPTATSAWRSCCTGSATSATRSR